MDELVKQKLIKSYKILMGEASNEDDFDLILMTEVENFASYDPDPVRDAKRDEIEKESKRCIGRGRIPENRFQLFYAAGNHRKKDDAGNLPEVINMIISKASAIICV